MYFSLADLEDYSFALIALQQYFIKEVDWDE